MNEDNKEFWVKLGIDIGEAKECSKNTKESVDKIDEKFDKFISNDFKHLDEKVDKLDKKVAVIVGGISLLWILVQIALKVLPFLK